jgi:hypothetical protein
MRENETTEGNRTRFLCSAPTRTAIFIEAREKDGDKNTKIERDTH